MFQNEYLNKISNSLDGATTNVKMWDCNINNLIASYVEEDFGENVISLSKDKKIIHIEYEYKSWGQNCRDLFILKSNNKWLVLKQYNGNDLYRTSDKIWISSDIYDDHALKRHYFDDCFVAIEKYKDKTNFTFEEIKNEVRNLNSTEIYWFFDNISNWKLWEVSKKYDNYEELIEMLKQTQKWYKNKKNSDDFFVRSVYCPELNLQEYNLKRFPITQIRKALTKINKIN